MTTPKLREPSVAALTIGSLFSGIGGLELGLEWAGLGPVLWQVEQDPFCQAVLAKHWPNAERFVDHVQVVSRSNLAPVDLICGGFPCQDVSSAGKGEGLTGERSGLWREFARVVGEFSPPWVVVENVTSGATRWVDQVCGELEQLGYEVLPVPLSAFDVGAPHIRRRVFIVAHAHGEQLREQPRRSGGENGGCASESTEHGGTRVASDRDRDRESTFTSDGEVARVRELATHSSPWSTAPEFRRVVDGIPNRLERLAALGNAVVPQCAEVVGWVIRELMEESNA